MSCRVVGFSRAGITSKVSVSWRNLAREWFWWLAGVRLLMTEEGSVVGDCSLWTDFLVVALL